MKNRLLNIILLAVMAVMINACAKTPKKPDIEPIITEQDTIDDVDPIPDPETEARKNRWSAGEMDR
jgi:hypothetical protein